MKKHAKWLTVVMVLALAMFAFGACGGGEEEPAEEANTAAWTDEYVKLMDSDEKTDYANYDAIMQVLRDFQTDEGAQYVYCVYPEDAKKLDGSYLLSVDASEEPDEWGTDYGYEIQFEEAMNGEVAAARSAWQDGDDAWCWSAFAPVKDADGTVVAVVGIDYPAPLMKDYPEWDRDNDKWNGEEGEWPDNMPEELDTFVKECKDRVAKLADQLSEQVIEIQK